MLFGMKETCERTGLNYETLKYYCNQGLVPNVGRDAANRRVFDRYDVAWIKDLACLKRCGMSIEEMKAYLALCLEGPSSIGTRREMLAKKRAALLERIVALRASVEYIDWKQSFYDDVQSGKIPYVSNLIRKPRALEKERAQAEEKDEEEALC